LIIDAYNSLVETAEAADAAVADRTDLLGRWLAVAHSMRNWALAARVRVDRREPSGWVRRL